MKLTKSVAAAALALVVATAPAALAKNNKAKNKHKSGKHDRNVTQVFTQFDHNGDGLISRSEFPGSSLQFDRLDTNRDSVLTSQEAQAFARSGNMENELRQLDTNRDGMISRHEWRGNAETFDRLDRNRDGVISQADRGVRRDGNRDDRNTGKRFHGLDKNRDGVITRSEWRGNDRSFEQHDRNNDGVLSGRELRSK